MKVKELWEVFYGENVLLQNSTYDGDDKCLVYDGETDRTLLKTLGDCLVTELSVDFDGNLVIVYRQDRKRSG